MQLNVAVDQSNEFTHSKGFDLCNSVYAFETRSIDDDDDKIAATDDGCIALHQLIRLVRLLMFS